MACSCGGARGRRSHRLVQKCSTRSQASRFCLGDTFSLILTMCNPVCQSCSDSHQAVRARQKGQGREVAPRTFATAGKARATAGSSPRNVNSVEWRNLPVSIRFGQEVAFPNTDWRACQRLCPRQGCATAEMLVVPEQYSFAPVHGKRRNAEGVL